MLQTVDLGFNFGSQMLFDGINIKFTPGNCFGIIGANGAGKSTLMKILAGEYEPTRGEVLKGSGMRLSVLKQDHHAFDNYQVLETVMRGHSRLIEVINEKDAIYAKADFSEADGVRAAELEGIFAELEGWEAEAEAGTLLGGLGVKEDLHGKKLSELEDDQKVKVLLAQALFGKPDILLLDEPTNHLDAKSIFWLENFLLDFKNTCIVISHDRHFLNKICTHMVDVDYRKATLYVGNYDFWQQSSELAVKLRSNQNKKSEEKAKELEAFIRRFSANASKSKQATSRRKQLDRLTIEDIPQSIRKHPHIVFEQEREAGDILLQVSDLSKSIDGVKVLDQVSFEIDKGDKVLFHSTNERSLTALFQILAGEIEPDGGSFKWGVTTTRAYLPKDNGSYFNEVTLDLIDWLRDFSEDKSENFVRSFLGRMLFTGEDTKKQAQVLSGGEKVRCMISRMMLQKANVLMLDGPTNHLDLESISALNNGLIKFTGTVMFATHDYEFANTLATRLFSIEQGRCEEFVGSYDELIGSSES